MATHHSGHPAGWSARITGNYCCPVRLTTHDKFETKVKNTLDKSILAKTMWCLHSCCIPITLRCMRYDVYIYMPNICNNTNPSQDIIFKTSQFLNSKLWMIVQFTSGVNSCFEIWLSQFYGSPTLTTKPKPSDLVSYPKANLNHTEHVLIPKSSKDVIYDFSLTKVG